MTATCDGPQCDKPAKVHGLCSGHNFQRSRGRELAPIARYETPLQRLMAKVRVDGSGCWLWTASLNEFGYGLTTPAPPSTSKLAHRVVYEITRGKLPSELSLDHLCRVRACVNPNHLEPVTHAENMLRSDNRERMRDVCEKGHPYTRENTLRMGPDKRWRICLTCKRDFSARFGRAKRNRQPGGNRGAPATRTTCPRGHLYDEGNTYVDKSGKRHCRRCSSYRRALSPLRKP